MNQYTAEWIDTFLATIDPAQTQREMAFLQRQLPRNRFTRVLDICCGLGRHSVALASIGYDVTGIDRDPALIAQAKLVHSNARFIAMDIKDLASLNGSFDAVICMWQSFGYLDSNGNEELLASIASELGTGGRFVLDIYDRDFFEPRQGTLTTERAGKRIRETKSMDGDRLLVELVYDEDESRSDRFDWQIFTPTQIASLAGKHGLIVLTSCTGFDETKPPSGQSPRMQIVFEKV